MLSSRDGLSFVGDLSVREYLGENMEDDLTDEQAVEDEPVESES